jgi:5'-3' exonuclease
MNNNILNIIQNTPISPLAFANNTITLNQMGKIDKRYPVLLVDTSFWLYYRFFALRNWYKRAYPDIVGNNPNFNLEHNWFEDVIFMNKYQKLFIDNIKTICKKYKTLLTNVVFCIDCSHKDMWRLEDYKDYKGTRLDSHLRNEFNSYNLFSYIKKTYLPQLQLLYGVKIIYNHKCEADDIIGHFAPYLINNGFSKVLLLANDNDYLQICNNKIYMINGNGQPNENSFNENTTICIGEQYLIKKILIGDTSDNIKCCCAKTGFLDTNNSSNSGNSRHTYKNIYKNIAINIINDSSKYEILRDILNKIRNGTISSSNDISIESIKNFYENTILMDFQMLPKNLKNELLYKFNNLI